MKELVALVVSCNSVEQLMLDYGLTKNCARRLISVLIRRGYGEVEIWLARCTG